MDFKKKVTTQNRHSGLDPESLELEMLKRVQHDAWGYYTKSQYAE